MSFPWANEYKPQNAVTKWVDERLPLPRLVYNAVGAGYPVPRNLNYFWNFGVLAGVALVIQIVTGIVLAMHYYASVDGAFNSVEHIMRDVNAGWFIRYAHMNGASFFFIVVYIHIFRGLFYGSYKAPREMIWLLGVVIFLLMMATAFMGYVLPWGQMSFWGAQVITGFFSAIPLVGEPLRQLLLGGFAPDQAALNRFFSLHYLLPFVIAGVIILHVWALHIPGSSNPTGVSVKAEQDTVPFHPYYTAKDGFGLGIFLIGFVAITFFAPNLLGHPDNYIQANPLSTPAHIVPEWYFLPFYAILKAFTVNFGIPFTGIVLIEAKLMGVLAMFVAVLPALAGYIAGAFGPLSSAVPQVLLVWPHSEPCRVDLLRCATSLHPVGCTEPDRSSLLLRSLLDHPAYRFAYRTAASAAKFDHRSRDRKAASNGDRVKQGKPLSWFV